MIGIYKITSPTGRIYIGSSKNIKNRLKYYKSLDCKGQTRLYNSFKKHGYNNHKIDILEECLFEELYIKENYYGMLFNVLGVNGLNCVLPKFDSFKKHISEETKIKMSERQKGIKNHFYGKKHSEETKQKLRLFQTGRKHTEEHRKKVSLNNAKNNSKIILDLSNGVFYNSAKELSDLYNIKHSTLRSRLNGLLVNNTNFIYA